MQPPTGDFDIDELVAFVFDIYRATEGEYPFLEWLDRKPSLDDFKGFKRVYHSFLEERMKHEFDKVYVWKNEGIIGTAAL